MATPDHKVDSDVDSDDDVFAGPPSPKRVKREREEEEEETATGTVGVQITTSLPDEDVEVTHYLLGGLEEFPGWDVLKEIEELGECVDAGLKLIDFTWSWCGGEVRARGALVSDRQDVLELMSKARERLLEAGKDVPPTKFFLPEQPLTHVFLIENTEY